MSLKLNLSESYIKNPEYNLTINQVNEIAWIDSTNRKLMEITHKISVIEYSINSLEKHIENLYSTIRRLEAVLDHTPQDVSAQEYNPSLPEQSDISGSFAIN